METIKSSTEISQVFAQGKRLNAASITILVYRTQKQHGLESGRVAFIAGKKLGNAVWRNSAKRRMRAVAFDLGLPIPGYDVVFIAKSSILSTSYQKLLSSCSRAIEEIE